MITLDITLVVHTAIILGMMYVLNKILYIPIREILEKRMAIKEQLDLEALEFEKSARARQKVVENQRRQASGKAKAALEKARSEAKAVGDEKLAVIRADANAEKGKQLEEIRVQMESAKETLRENTADFANDMAAKILGRSLKA